MKYYVGIDLGGTNIKAGVVDENYKIIAKASVKTNCPRPAEEIADDMAEVCRQAVKNANLTMDDIECVGVGIPGVSDASTGMIEFANNLNFVKVPMGPYLEERLHKKITMGNDANAAAYGEFVAGAARGYNDAICITLGTGVGSGIVLNRKIFEGFRFEVVEMGHQVLEVDGPQCTCGRRGCFEVYSSATGLIRMTKEAMEEHKDSLMWSMREKDGRVTARLAFDAMRAGDAAAKAVCDKYIKYLAHGLANIINTFMPDIICIGGGVCNEGDALLKPVIEKVRGEVYTKNIPNFDRNTKIVRAELGNDAGIIGAAFLHEGLPKRAQ